MKKILLIAVLALLSGCALDQYYQACKADQTCMDRAHGVQDKTQNVATVVTGVIPVPAVAASAPVVGKVAGYAGLLIAMLIGGHALTTKKKAATP